MYYKMKFHLTNFTLLKRNVIKQWHEFITKHALAFTKLGSKPTFPLPLKMNRYVL